MSTPCAMTRRDFVRTTAAFSVAGCFCPLTTHAAPEDAYQIGCYTRPWDQYDYRVALDGIAAAGYRYAGLMTAKGKTWVMITVDSTPEEVMAISEAVKARGLKTLSIYG